MRFRFGAVTVIETPSPNHGARADAGRSDLVVLHYTGMQSAQAALDRLCDPAAEVSAHYLIEQTGAVHRLVEERRLAWHAGVASWHRASNINDRSIGIELVNPGHEFGYRPFPEPQMAALETLLAGILTRRKIGPHRVVGHSDVAPMRKQDPGELFNWQRLSKAGLAFWPAALSTQQPADPPAARSLLRRWGYGIGQDQVGLHAGVIAFQRRFRPARCDGVPDRETMGLLVAVADQMR